MALCVRASAQAGGALSFSEARTSRRSTPSSSHALRTTPYALSKTALRNSLPLSWPANVNLKISSVQLESWGWQASGASGKHSVERKVVAHAERSRAATSEEPANKNAEQLYRARMMAKRKESYVLTELEKPLAEYMTLPASQYSVLDAERIERIDANTFRCYAHRVKFLAFELCPVLLVRVEEQPDGCIIRLLSCTLEGSDVVVAQNKKFSASMVNKVKWMESKKGPTQKEIFSDTVIEVELEIPPAFRLVSADAIESTGNRVLGQILQVFLPRFLQQLGKDYRAWAKGDASRKPLGTGEL